MEYATALFHLVSRIVVYAVCIVELEVARNGIARLRRCDSVSRSVRAHGLDFFQCMYCSPIDVLHSVYENVLSTQSDSSGMYAKR